MIVRIVGKLLQISRYTAIIYRGLEQAFYKRFEDIDYFVEIMKSACEAIDKLIAHLKECKNGLNKMIEVNTGNGLDKK